jgi:hypothetical protein
MHDVTISLGNRPGELARMGEALGSAGVSIEGGGAFLAGNNGIAHFLFHDGGAARAVLEREGITVLAVRDVVVQKLRQDEPGQLGKLCREMALADVNIEVLYSDHSNQLILVVDDLERARAVSAKWSQRAGSTGEGR